MNISVLGAGAWGTAIAAHAARRGEVALWARDAAQVADMGRAQCNARYLPGITLPDSLRVTDDFDAATDRACGAEDILVLGVPLAGLAETCGALARRRVRPRNIVWLCKGFDAATGAMPHQIVAAKFAGLAPVPALAVLSGPSFAREVAQGLPCALTVASADAELRALVQHAFHHHGMRVYGSDDIVGVEVGGALKNIMAIAAGACDGLGLGLNARAALVTRGLAEMTRLGVVLGGKIETFMGLTGIGDLLLTATGDLSRNRTVGLRLAEGLSLQQILGDLGHVAEGVRCARAVRELARASGVDMPITAAVCAVLFDGMPAAEAVSALLSRDARAETT